MKDNIKEVKRSRASLNIKIRFVFINEKNLVYHQLPGEEERMWKSSNIAGCPEAFI